MSNQPQSPTSLTNLTRLAMLIGGCGLLVGGILLALVPQRPDGDSTAIALFDAEGTAWWHNVRGAFWFNLCGALGAWGAFNRWLRIVPRIGKGRVVALNGLVWTGLLIAWCGWAWNQARGWEGELFIAPGEVVPLGVDREPDLIFSQFLRPPAPDGPGRALALRLIVDGVAHEVAVGQGYRAAGWTITPHWYGAIVQSTMLEEPLFFGLSGSRKVTLRDGRTAAITVDVEALRATSVPPLPSLQLQHYAVLKTRFAPGDRLIWVGVAMLLPAFLLTLYERHYNNRKQTFYLSS